MVTTSTPAPPRTGGRLSPARTRAVREPAPASLATPEALGRADRLLWRAVVAVFLAYTAVPAFLNIVAGGRRPPDVWGMATLYSSSAGQRASSALLALLLGLSLVTIASGGRGRRRANGVLVAVLGLAAVGAVASATMPGPLVPTALIVNVAVVLAVWRLAPAPDDLTWFAHCATVLALVAAAYGLVSDDAWMLGTTTGLFETKAIIGTGLLAGPYPHMNNLGMSLAMALPFVLLVRRTWLRLAEAGILAGVLVLTSSRTSLLAVAGAVAAGLALVLLGRRSRLRSTVSVCAVLLVAAVAVAMPWLTDDAQLFTNRGQIWIWTREAVGDRPLYGYGFGAFGDDSALSASIGWVAGAAHNMPLHYLAVAGVLGLVALVALVGTALRGAVELLPRSAAGAIFVVTFAVLCITEMPFRLESTVGQAWIGLPALVALGALPRVAGARRPAHGRARTARVRPAGQDDAAPQEPTASTGAAAIRSTSSAS